MMKIMWRWLTIASIVLTNLSFGAELEEVVKPSYTFGRFVVIDHGPYLEIEGGVFTPPAGLPLPPSVKLKATGRAPQHVIYINYAKSELLYYRLDSEGVYGPVKGYAVVTPAAYPDTKNPNEFTLRRDVVRGEVTRIVAKPSWCPKVGGQIQRDNPKLAGCYPYGHPLNPMGEYSFHISWDTPGWQLVRLHGARLYPEEFNLAETYGCTRLHNPAIVELVSTLGEAAVAEGIEVVVHRSQLLNDLVQ